MERVRADDFDDFGTIFGRGARRIARVGPVDHRLRHRGVHGAAVGVHDEHRVAIAAESRNAPACALCAERKAALSPYGIDGTLEYAASHSQDLYGHMMVFGTFEDVSANL